MPHYLDVGFHWTDKTADGSPPENPGDAATLSYAFQHDHGAGAGQKDFRADVGDRFELRVFELTGEPAIELVNTIIDVVNVSSSGHPAPSPTHRSGPDEQDPIPRLEGTHTPHPAHGKHEVPSVGLNALGTAWFPTGPLVLTNEGTFLITVRIEAIQHGSRRYWVVDPKLIVGTG